MILLLPVVSLQLIVSVVFIQRHFEGVTELMSRSVATELSYLLTSAEASDDPKATLDRIGGALGYVVAHDPAPGAVQNGRAFYDLSGRVMTETLRARIPEIGSVDLLVNWRVRLWLDAPHGAFVLEFGRDRVSASNPHQLIVIIVVMGALMSLIAYSFLRNQLKPIKRMAEAAAEFGKGRVVPYRPTGAVEVRAAGAAFLEMRNRIERHTQSRTRMLSGISHDLRTPLTRLRLGLSMMDEDEAAPLIRDVTDMQRLVDAFLEFGSENAGDLPESTDPIALVKQVVEDAGRGGQPVTLTGIDGIEPATMMMLRPMALRRALENLIGNGLRYGSKVEINLSAFERSLRFRVEDDGPGIAPEDRDEAIRPFARLDPARNQDKGTGVGLGLAIVADIARLHGGSLRLGTSETLGGLCADLIVAK